jgi:glycerophosphoryl diester phosphodiesterase
MKKTSIFSLAALALFGAASCGNVEVEVYTLGQTQTHPNAVVVDVKDAVIKDVVWSQDGQVMGQMVKTDNVIVPAVKDGGVHNFYVAVPSPGAENVTVTVKAKGGKAVHELDFTDIIDAQAHRGGMGLYPENSIPAFKNSLDLGANTLEMDLCVTKDGKVVLSHDPAFEARYTTKPDGKEMKRGEEPYVYHLTYDEIAKYDVGMRSVRSWPEKACVPAVKPLLTDVITFVENYTKENGLTPVKYNIEIKSDYTCSNGEEGRDWPEYKEFVDICAPVIASFGLGDRLIVQSFDDRALNYLHEKYPEFTLSYLIRDHDTDFDKFMGLLNFTPEWLSPNFAAVTPEFLAEAAKRGMKVVTWTVDQPEDLQRMIDLKVDAIITNYPDRLLKLLEENK